MKKTILFLILLCTTIIHSQNNKELALDKAREAISLMDNGQIDESIKLLEEGEKLDPKNYLFSYEIAYAHVLKEDYETALKILKKTKKFKDANSQVYQMSGNCYSYLGHPEKAIKEYEKGLKKFPNAGNLYLEKANIYNMQENYNEAVKNYEDGIKVDPMYASNYYQLAKLFLNSTDKLSGLIYGEIFVNIETGSNRTLEISQLLFTTYKNSITLGETESEIDFCEIVIDASAISKKSGELELPLCAIFGKNFILGIIGIEEINLDTLSKIRTTFLNNYFKDDHRNYPNVLFKYQKKMLDEGIFDTYNHYIFQMGAEDEFRTWKQNNEDEFNRFVDWYTKESNGIKINKRNLFIK